jgi:hypothetical protein
MKRLLTSILLCTSCDTETKVPVVNFQSSKPSTKEEVSRFFSDMSRFAEDGTINERERIEILRRCGYSLDVNYVWKNRKSSIWNGREYQPLNDDIYAISFLGEEDFLRLIESYKK